MNDNKYIGMDVHKSSTSVAVVDEAGKLISETTIRTEAKAIQEFFGGLRGNVQVSLEESTQAQWLYELLSPIVDRKSTRLNSSHRT
mgnify:CR=1 FL=1